MEWLITRIVPITELRLTLQVFVGLVAIILILRWKNEEWPFSLALRTKIRRLTNKLRRIGYQDVSGRFALTIRSADDVHNELLEHIETEKHQTEELKELIKEVIEELKSQK